MLTFDVVEIAGMDEDVFGIQQLNRKIFFTYIPLELNNKMKGDDKGE